MPTTVLLNSSDLSFVAIVAADSNTRSYLYFRRLRASRLVSAELPMGPSATTQSLLTTHIHGNRHLICVHFPGSRFFQVS